MSTEASVRPRHVRPVGLAEIARAAGAGPTVAAGGAVPDADVRVTGVTHDSRQVRAGDLFAALAGANSDGADFLEHAARAGAVAALVAPEAAARARAAGLPVVVTPRPRAVLGEVASLVYGHPSRDLLVLGVTGTNGKTTTVFMLDAVLRAAGRRTGLIGTVVTRIGDDEVPSVRTTPEATDVHALLAVMRENGVTACAMEVSSHGLAYGRIDGVAFEVAAFTNLSQDHLDLHGDMESYFAAKAGLFTPDRCRSAVVCVDDDWGRRLARSAAVRVTTVATASAGADADPGAADWVVGGRETGRRGGTLFDLRSRDGRHLRVACDQPGEFNVANAAVAAVTALTAGVDPAVVARGLAVAPAAPGRMQRVEGIGAVGIDDPLVVVDYAHTPEAVAKAARALRDGRPSGPLVVVVGAGGDRDPGKRPLMGAAAAGVADVVVVTDDNPRSEDPAAIRAAVLGGASRVAAGRGARAEEIGDRRAAIAAAVEIAGPGGTVLVAGRGHERYQEAGGELRPLDDREVVADVLARRAEVRGGSA